MERLTLGLGLTVTPWELEAVARGEAALALDGSAWARVAACHEFAQDLIGQRRRIYGVTTGFGPLAGTYVDPAASARLQRNLIYHLASGVGPALPREAVRALMAARAIGLARGHSAIRPASLGLLLDCLNADLVPEVPALGTVGASGDLTPLAHLSLALMGEGRLWVEGRLRPAGEVLRERGLTPLDPQGKDALALVNGTSAMTGIAALNAARAGRALEWSLVLSLLYAELLEGRREAWHPALGELRPHPGQCWVHDRLAVLARSSARLRPLEPLPVLPETGTAGLLPGQPLPQDPYTLRCLPQLLGAVREVLEFHGAIVTRELNAVTDNPVFFPERGEVLHGGNFYGQQVACAADALNPGLITLAVHGERVIARLTNPLLNHGLPAFLAPRDNGLNSGFMGAQVTATALVAELRTLAVPASIQSIPTNADNQDVVTLGTVAARRSMEILDRLYELLAIEALVLAQAMELRGGGGYADSSRVLWRLVREGADFLDRDRPLGGEISALARRLQEPGSLERVLPENHKDLPPDQAA